VATDKVYVGELIMNKFKMIAAAVASTVALASPVFAEWTAVSESVSGSTYYIDYDTVKENNGYVYYWELQDRLKPTETGILSVKFLMEVDCDIPRKIRPLSFVFYNQPMGGGNGDAQKSLIDEWKYASPNSVFETLTNAVCEHAGK